MKKVAKKVEKCGNITKKRQNCKNLLFDALSSEKKCIFKFE